MHAPILIIMGPTASGKSALAAAAAQRLGGVVINADAMQLYREIPILSAQPSLADRQAAAHLLYGTRSIADGGCVASWLEAAAGAIEQCIRAGQLPILTGGTGMYVQRLMEGIAAVPEISQPVRGAVRARWEASAPGAFHAELMARDPQTASRLKPGDKQRLMRAMEVLEETGQSLSQWQAAPQQGSFARSQFHVMAMEVPRPQLYARINARFDAMVKNGALEEARALMQAGFSPDLPGMRACGVPELLAYLRGEMTLEAASDKAKQLSRNYAKRQLTWLRNQLPQALPVSHSLLEDAAKLEIWLEETAKSVDRVLQRS